jgi:hypothetical protein
VDRPHPGVARHPDHQQTEIGGEPEHDEPPDAPDQQVTTTGVVDEDRRRRWLHAE